MHGDLKILAIRRPQAIGTVSELPANLKGSPTFSGGNTPIALCASYRRLSVSDSLEGLAPCILV